MTFRLGLSGLEGVPSAAELARLRAGYLRRHCLRLPGFFAPPLLAFLRREIREKDFRERPRGKTGLESYLASQRVLGLLDFLVNDPALFRVVEGVLGCPRVRIFRSKIYRMVPGHPHHKDWHQDTRPWHQVAMSVNLSPGRFGGGVLQIRDRRSGRMLYEGANTGPGDAVLFPVAPHLEHQVTDVAGRGIRMAYAGWFLERPAFSAMLRRSPSPVRQGGAFRSALRLSDRVKASASAAWRRSGKTTLLFGADRGVITELDGVGGRLWSLLAAGSSLRGVCEALAREYDAPASRLERDVLRVAQGLRGAGLLVKG